MDKLYRHNQILRLIANEIPATQDELRRKLGRKGIEVTQATLSRDLDEIGVIKTRDGYRLPEAREVPVPQPPLATVLKEFVQEAMLAANLVIVKTHPGNAHTVAAALDSEEWEEVVGTVAGDDTIFVATQGARAASRVRKRIQTLLAS